MSSFGLIETVSYVFIKLYQKLFQLCTVWINCSSNRGKTFEIRDWRPIISKVFFFWQEVRTILLTKYYCLLSLCQIRKRRMREQDERCLLDPIQDLSFRWYVYINFAHLFRNNLFIIQFSEYLIILFLQNVPNFHFKTFGHQTCKLDFIRAFLYLYDLTLVAYLGFYCIESGVFASSYQC